jgi:hypothetical protein
MIIKYSLPANMKYQSSMRWEFSVTATQTPATLNQITAPLQQQLGVVRDLNTV